MAAAAPRELPPSYIIEMASMQSLLTISGKNGLIEKVRKCKDGSGENSILEVADKGLRVLFDE